MAQPKPANPLLGSTRVVVFWFAILVVLSFLSIAKAAPKEVKPKDVQTMWKEFQANPKAFMNKPPQKWLVQKGTGPVSRFTVKDVTSNNYVEKKATLRTDSENGATFCDDNGTCLPDVLEGRALADTSIDYFLDQSEFDASLPQKKIARTLEEIEARNLKAAKLPNTPWSDTYWPIAEGILGNRYANSPFRSNVGTWKSSYDFVFQQGSTLYDVYTRGNQEELNELSPSEKYDLLIGPLVHTNGTYATGYLTPRMWDEGRRYWDSKGTVERWMGICHGWAPASFMLPRPTKSVELTAWDGRTKLKFYPSDIKGLSSYLWAKSTPGTRFIGGRCNTKNPPRDEQTGRILASECFDVNPANWHLIVVNQIGVAQRSLVLDATYDYEVWNQPMYGYSYRYFNPQTGAEVATLAEATVSVENFTNDKFKNFRGEPSRTKKIVGVVMDVQYIVETLPSHRETDSSDWDRIASTRYMYDLQLDENNQIVGGEWYYNAHPDFLWMPLNKTHAASFGESTLMGSNDIKWVGNFSIPRFWTDIAIATAYTHGQPLGLVVENLIEKANTLPAPQPQPATDAALPTN